MAWVNLAGIHEEIEKAKTELDWVSKLLGEKRSLWDKMLGRNKGVGA